MEALAGWVIDALSAIALAAASVFLAKPGSVLGAHFALHNLGWSITGFWLCSCAVPFLIYAKYRASKATAQSVEQRIAREHDAVLARTGQLLATAAVTQGALHEAYTQAIERQYSALSPREAVELIAGDIRIALTTVTALVGGVEPPQPGAQIAANLMYFIPIDPQAPTVLARVNAALGLEVGKAIADQRGVLFLDPDLSACTEVETGGRDPNLQDLAFYVPRSQVDRASKGILQMLPGAPDAFVTRKMIATDTKQLIALSRDSSHAVSKEAADALEEYFQSNAAQHIRSVVCHPLMMVDGKQPRAVLNIHSNYEGMLNDPERRQQLYYLLRPWTLVFLKLLELLERYQAEAGGLSPGPVALPAPGAAAGRPARPEAPRAATQGKHRGKKGRRY